ncbi:MAG TPA: EamA family transporter [Gemmatimonadales bacterium]|nr:EamA family transporter [Gemmatimonadales bacterium]
MSPDSRATPPTESSLPESRVVATAARVTAPTPGAGAARGRWLVFGAAVLWGMSATLARFMFRDRHIPPFTVVELRLSIAVLLLGPWLAWRRPAVLRIDWRDLPSMIVLGVVGVATIQGSYYYSISVLGVGLAILLQYLAPALIVIWHMARGEKVRWPTMLSVVLAVAGTALLVEGVDARALHARWWQWSIGFGTAVVFAFYILYSKRLLRRYQPETVLVYSFAIAAAFWAVITPPWRIVAAGYDGQTWALFIVIGITSVLAPFAMFYAGLRTMESSRVAIVATLEPVVAVVSSAVVLQEGLRLVQWAGAVMVLVASIVASTTERDETG